MKIPYSEKAQKILNGSGLISRCARGGTVLVAGNIIERIFRFGKNVVLARLLAPDQFGLMATVMAISAAFEAFAEVGVKQSIIQNPRGREREYLNVAWWFQVVRGTALYAAAFFFSPYISRFYEQPELLPLMRVAFTVIFLNGLISPRAYVLEKDFQFNKSVFITQGSGLLGTIVTISLAFYVRSVWVLVIGFIAEAFLKLVLTYILCPFRPGFYSGGGHLRDLLRFANGMFGMPILTLLTFRADVIVLGKVVSSEQLGYYYLALSLAQVAFDMFERAVNPVLLAAFSEKQSERDVIRIAVLRVTAGVALFFMPFLTLQIIFAKPALVLAYGANFAAVSVPFSLLSIYLLFRAQGIIIAQTFMGLGRPDLNRRFVAVRAVILFCIVYPLCVKYGLSGAALTLILSSMAGLLMQYWWVKGLIGLRAAEYAKCWLPGLLMSVATAVPAGGAVFLRTGSNIFEILLALLIYCVVIAAALFVFRHYLSSGFYKRNEFSAQCA